jgi:hypothetical protein
LNSEYIAVAILMPNISAIIPVRTPNTTPPKNTLNATIIKPISATINTAGMLSSIIIADTPPIKINVNIK